jgi:hypothetical protein
MLKNLFSAVGKAVYGGIYKNVQRQRGRPLLYTSETKNDRDYESFFFECFTAFIKKIYQSYVTQL